MILENQSLHLEIARLEAEVAGLKAENQSLREAGRQAEAERDAAVARSSTLEQGLRDIEERLRTRVAPIREALNATPAGKDPEVVAAWKWAVYGSCIHAQLVLGQAASDASEPTPGQPVSILYTNWRGETGVRRILPKSIRFAATEWHPEPQWLLEAADIDKGASRSFALKDIRAWGLPDEEVDQP